MFAFWPPHQIKHQIDYNNCGLLCFAQHSKKDTGKFIFVVELDDDHYIDGDIIDPDMLSSVNPRGNFVRPTDYCSNTFCE